MMVRMVWLKWSGQNSQVSLARIVRNINLGTKVYKLLTLFSCQFIKLQNCFNEQALFTKILIYPQTHLGHEFFHEYSLEGSKKIY